MFPITKSIVNEVGATITGSEVEVVQWTKQTNKKKTSDTMEAEVWMNNGAIEGKIPASQMRKFTRSSKRN